MPIARVNGIGLNYVQMGSEGGPAQEDLVLVHGLATNMAFWYFHYAPRFSRQFRVTLLDLRGHGGSDMPGSGYTPRDMATDLRGLLDHLDIKRAHFLAHSFGGGAVLNMACASPGRISSLVLADTHISAVRHVRYGKSVGHRREIQSLLDACGIKLDPRDPFFGYQLLTEVARLQLRSAEVPQALLDLISPVVGRYGSRTAAQWVRLMDTTQAEKELMVDDGLSLDRLREFNFPILALYGDNSRAFLTGSELLGVWPHAEFRRLRGAGHFFPASRPEEVIDLCERFWTAEFAATPRHRDGEMPARHFRSDRIYQSGGKWYFLARENACVGPFSDQEEARQHLAAYIAAMSAAFEQA